MRPVSNGLHDCRSRYFSTELSGADRSDRTSSHLFGRVLLPESVLHELQHPKVSAKVFTWASQLPSWLEVKSPSVAASDELMRLDPGERDAIQLAIDLGITTVLLDEWDGRQLAEKLRLEVRGTLGILERGAKLGKINFRDALSKLEQTNFRISPGVKEAFLRRNR
jgi:predicted nucleic acid-binding protein